jgi:hypothetical protein
METSLHRDLKILYAGRKARFEVPWEGGYRIDAVAGGRLIEVQHSALGAIRDKIAVLLENHKVTIVKPIVATRMLVKQTERGGEVMGRRMSPKRGNLLDLFDELVHFTRVFPHPRLTLEVLLVDVEEWRYPGHGRRRRWRENDHEVEDERLVAIQAKHRIRTAADLAKLVRANGVKGPVPKEFHTGHLAQSLGVPRWMAQRIAYCLVRMEQLSQVGQQGNARVYRWARKRQKTAVVARVEIR